MAAQSADARALRGGLLFAAPLRHNNHSMDLNALPLPDLYAHLASTGSVRRLLLLARDEDLGPSPAAGDLTSLACIDPEARGELVLSVRSPCVVAGLATMPDLLALFSPGARFEPAVADGQALPPGATLGRLSGPTRELLALERTMLNLLSRLSGVATRTAAHVAAMGADAHAHLYDTRKTTPGLRALEKYAVRCGGGYCHRLGLYDAALIKDNHLAGISLERLADFVQAAARRARAITPNLWFIEVEVDSLRQLERILPIAHGLIDAVLLDNMTTAQVESAVEMRGRLAPGVQLEVSGSVTIETLPDLARTGVERISSGSITHHAVWVDIGLDTP